MLGSVTGPRPASPGTADALIGPRADDRVSVYRIDPLTDARWARLLDRYPDASVYHTRGWLSALKAVYGYEVLAFTTSPPHDELAKEGPGPRLLIHD